MGDLIISREQRADHRPLAQHITTDKLNLVHQHDPIHSPISKLYDFDLLYYDTVMGEGVPLYRWLVLIIHIKDKVVPILQITFQWGLI